ncbi:hypothetical protein G9272_27870 [Streptomyces asoensis]|uniref:Lipoprotein n=1 Tax=Streptomyces asoensis TaxID=249586 RepID=A0A6M4WSZ8_9ACTN|nr:hypothetical protein [Streptomyces asoensis]QJT03630.1 hypothetical protein G9272_27870 [Streptomyces asoensis]
MADARRRLRSGTVVLGGMGVLAAALSACSSDPDKRCVDRDSYNLTKGYKVVADKNCKSTQSAKTSKTSKVSVDSAWYYGGDKKGSWVDGGSFTKPGKGSGGSTGSSSTSGGSSSGGSSGSSGGSGVDRNGFGSGSDSDSGVGKGSSGG